MLYFTVCIRPDPRTSRDGLNCLLGGLLHKTLLWSNSLTISQYQSVQYQAESTESTDMPGDITFAIDSLINIQIQPTNDEIAKCIDTKICVTCVKMVLHSFTIKIYQF
jgi:hypothetical protein